MAELIVITGAAFAGKTAVIRELAARGYPTIHEAAIEVIEELVTELGVEEQIAWRQRNQQEFQRRLSLRQHGREAEAGVPAVEEPRSSRDISSLTIARISVLLNRIRQGR